MTYFPSTKITNGLSTFAEFLTAELSPDIQVMFPYAVNADMATSATSGTGAAATWSAGLLSLASGTANNGYATLTTKNVLRYGPGQGADVRIAAIFGTANADNTQIVGIGGTSDGFFFGYNGTAFGVLRRSGGSDTWVAQASWNLDTFNGSGPSAVTLAPTNGNVYRITYQWLGFGAITFWIENPSTGEFIPVHRIRYANANTALSISNPTLPIYLSSLNGASGTTSCVIQCGSMSAYTQGSTLSLPFLRYSTGNSKSGVTTETNIITLKNLGTNVLGGTNTNRHPIQIDYVSIAAESAAASDPCVVRAVLNTTLGGTPSYASFSSATSVVQTDTAGTTLTGGTEKWSSVVGDAGNIHVDTTQLKLYLSPGDILTFAGSSASSAKIFVRVGWHETQ